MAVCPLCGQDVGLLRTEHAECRARHDEGFEKMVEAARASVFDETRRAALSTELSQLAAAHRVPVQRSREALTAGFTRAVENGLADGLLTEAEEHALLAWADQAGIDREQLRASGYLDRLVRGAALRELVEGQVPTRVELRDNPFNLQKSEQLVWVFKDVGYFRTTTSRQYHGSSTGVSVRVAKGVYFRTGSFQGRPIESETLTFQDRGLLAVTSKHLYFRGSRKSFRAPYRKIVSFEPFEDGIGYFRETGGATPRLEALHTGDGWFAYNLVVNLTNLASGAAPQLTGPPPVAVGGPAVAKKNPVKWLFMGAGAVILAAVAAGVLHERARARAQEAEPVPDAAPTEPASARLPVPPDLPRPEKQSEDEKRSLSKSEKQSTPSQAGASASARTTKAKKAKPTEAPAPKSRTCCRHCGTGKPCGNSCISVSRTCHQPPGCAC